MSLPPVLPSDPVPARRLRRPGDLRRVLLRVLLLGLMAAVHARGQAAPDSFERLLTRHVDAEGLVDYAGLAADGEAAAALEEMQTLAMRTQQRIVPENVQRALLINTYNAAVLKILLDAGVGHRRWRGEHLGA